MKLTVLLLAIFAAASCSTVHKTVKEIKKEMVPKTEMVEGCEGEGCSCTNETKTNQDFTLYEEPNAKSKVIGNLPAGTSGRIIKSMMKVFRPGRSRVVDVQKEALGVKKGDFLTYVIDEGDGFYKAKFHDQWIEFAENELTLEEIEKMEYEQWGEFQMGHLHGYANVFPFQNCLE